MPWTYAQVKTADAALNPPQSDPAAAAAALNAQTTTSTTPVTPIPISSIHATLLLSTTNDWQNIQIRANQSLSLTYKSAPIANDGYVMAARNAVSLSTSKLGTVDPSAWAAFLASVALLVTAGDISAATQTAIQALASYTQLVWTQPRPLTAGDVQTARAQ